MFVVEYAMKFEYILRFNAQDGDDACRSKRFKDGRLRLELQRFIVPLYITVFHLLVENNKIMELDHLYSRKDIQSNFLMVDLKIETKVDYLTLEKKNK